MSIIYEALKKLDKSPSSKVKHKHFIGIRLLFVFLFIFVASVISYIFMLANIKPRISCPKEPNPNFIPQPSLIQNTSQSLREKEDKALILNGIFYSEESYAVINNQIFREGDKVKNMTLKKITPHTIELETEDSQTLKLSIK